MPRTMIRRTSTIRTLLHLCLVLALCLSTGAWGRRAHQMVNAAAIKTLPLPLRSYFQAHQFFLVDHAIDPDLKARLDPRERPHHFADVDAYDRYPFLQFRKQFVAERLGPCRAQLSDGTVMWQIERFTRYLELDFRRSNWRDASQDAVYLAHYAADLTQPLHVVSNYDGQRTGQKGIHKRFEVGLVDLMADRWVLRPRPAAEIPNLRARIFEEFISSYRHSGAVFAADRRVRAFIPYTSPRFLPAFAKSAAPVAKAQLDDAASFVGSLWYTAWVRAGKPDLSAWKGQ
jgi:Zinc dependent phospholipase C